MIVRRYLVLYCALGGLFLGDVVTGDIGTALLGNRGDIEVFVRFFSKLCYRASKCASFFYHVLTRVQGIQNYIHCLRNL